MNVLFHGASLCSQWNWHQDTHECGTWMEGADGRHGFYGARERGRAGRRRDATHDTLRWQADLVADTASWQGVGVCRAAGLRACK